MSQFKTEADVMRQAASNVDNVNAETQGELKRLQGVVDGVAGSWAGSAQVSFDNLMVRYNTAATNLQQALTSISENIRSNATNYEHVESDNTRMFDTVGGGLNL